MVSRGKTPNRPCKRSVQLSVRRGRETLRRRCLDRLRNHQPSADPNKFWDELEIRLLRSEAEALIPYDPIFPAEPFAH